MTPTKNNKSLFKRVAAAFRNISERNLLLILAVVTGLASGFAAVILKKLIELIHHLLTSWFTTPGNYFLFLVYPGVGMLLAFLFVKYVIRDNIGHGVTKVLLAISKNESNIKGHNTWSSILTSSVTIGFGGSVGAEAPIVYTGAALGSNIARLHNLSYKNMTTLLGCGAAGAVAGIFKAPLAGVLFTLEILMFNISMTSMLPLLLSSLTATMVSYIFLGNAVPFSGSLETFAMGNLPYYLILGIFCGFVSLYFTRTTLFLEDRIRKVRNPYWRWAMCACGLGLLIFFFPPLYGEGYDSLSAMLNSHPIEAAGGIVNDSFTDNQWVALAFFAFVMMFKVLATALTNAGGGVGGTFGPTLFTGGIAGFVLARFINIIGIHPLPEANFVLVGMAGLMAGVMQAPMTAIFLIAEITGGYQLFFPLILTSVVSYGTIRTMEQYSIYTKRIAQQGELLTHDSDRAVLTLLKTSDFLESDFNPVQIDQKLGDLVQAVAHSHRNIFPVTDTEGHFEGIVYLDDIREYMFNTDLYDKIYIYNIMKNAPASVLDDEKMESVMRKFEDTDAWNIPVLDKDGLYLGFISKSKIFSSYREQLQQVSHD